MERTILHCDCNSFFASVELTCHPELRNVPVAVCGSKENRHGIVLAKNEAAKRFGITTAETVFAAQQKCPELVILPPHHDKYREYSQLANQIYGRYTDMIEPFSIDESWLDVTDSVRRFGSGRVIADNIREDIKNELGITVSVGVSWCKIFAKLGSDYKKPDATTVIDRENWHDIVDNLPVGELMFIGRRSAAMLHSMDINTIGQLAVCDRKILSSIFGKMGAQMYDFANGVDDSVVQPSAQAAKSVGNGMTFKRDLETEADIHAAVTSLSERTASHMRRDGLRCAAVQVMLRDPQFHNVVRRRKLPQPTQLSYDLVSATLEIISEEWKQGTPIRSISITGLDITETCGQLTLDFDESATRRSSVECALDSIRSKYGFNAVNPAAVLGNDIGIDTKFGKKKPSPIAFEKPPKQGEKQLD